DGLVVGDGGQLEHVIVSAATAAGGRRPRSAGPTTGPTSARHPSSPPTARAPLARAAARPARRLPRWPPILRQWARSQRNIAVFALRQFFTLGAQHLEALDEHAAGVGGVDDVVDVAPFGSAVGVDVALDVLLDELGLAGFGVVGLLHLP